MSTAPSPLLPPNPSLSPSHISILEQQQELRGAGGAEKRREEEQIMEEGSGGGKKKVMVAIDESDFSRYALEWTLHNLQHTIQDSGLLIFTAQPLSDLSYLHASSFGVTPGELVQSFVQNQKRAAEALLEKAKDICSRYGVAAETVTEAGDPKELICETVEKLNIELLVMGSHGRNDLQRAFLGSVSSYCVHHAKCPVLVVRKKD